MTLNKAIEHLKETLENKTDWTCAECKKEHEQLLNWLEVLEQFETLKNYYEPFKQFLKEMFEKGHNDDLTKVKEWLNEK